MSKQQMRTRLDVLNAELAKQVHSIKDHVILRLFACECAFLALTYCGNEDSRLLNAVDIGRRYAESLADRNELHRAYVDAERAAEAADELAFAALEAFEGSKGPRIEYIRAFGMARAAFSARFCCLESDVEAANEAAYEAWAALDTALESGNRLDELIPPNLQDADNNAKIIAIIERVLEKLNSSCS